MARSLLQKVYVRVFDESLAALDPESVPRIQRQLALGRRTRDVTSRRSQAGFVGLPDVKYQAKKPRSG